MSLTKDKSIEEREEIVMISWGPTDGFIYVSVARVLTAPGFAA
jgi:hypothetical protein